MNAHGVAASAMFFPSDSRHTRMLSQRKRTTCRGYPTGPFADFSQRSAEAFHSRSPRMPHT